MTNPKLNKTIIALIIGAYSLIVAIIGCSSLSISRLPDNGHHYGLLQVRGLPKWGTSHVILFWPPPQLPRHSVGGRQRRGYKEILPQKCTGIQYVKGGIVRQRQPGRNTTISPAPVPPPINYQDKSKFWVLSPRVPILSQGYWLRPISRREQGSHSGIMDSCEILF